MGSIFSTLLESVQCKSSCSLNHELHQDIDINFKSRKLCEMELSQKEIRILNKLYYRNTRKV